MNLTQTQQAFFNYLQTGTLDLTIIKGSANTHKQALAEVYHYAYRARFVEVLAEQYPKLAAYIGDAAFRQLVEQYVACYPSTYRNIRFLGKNLPDFIAQQEFLYLNASSPYCRAKDIDVIPAVKPRDDVMLNLPCNTAKISELARFEWALVEVFDAVNSPIFTMEQLQAVDPHSWPECKIIWQQAMQQHSFTIDVIEFWKHGARACKMDVDSPHLEAYGLGDMASGSPLPLGEGLRERENQQSAASSGSLVSNILFWRQNYAVYFAPLNATEQLFIASSQQGATIAELCGELTLLHHQDDISKVLLQLLQQFIERHCVADFLC